MLTPSRLLVALTLVISMSVSCAAPTVGQAEEGLVAHYAFEAGAGDVLRDHSGNEAHGKIHGPEWVKNGARWALQFDGEHDYVDCGDPPCLDLRNALALEAWVFPEERLFNYDAEVLILGKWINYALSRLGDETWAYINGGEIGHRVNAFLPFGKWVHLAQTFNGTVMLYYIDGMFVGAAKPGGKIPKGGNFYLASPEGKARFRGKIASVKVYNRALTLEEILADLRATNISRSVVPSAVPVGALGQIWVEVDAARLGEPLQNLSVKVEVRGPGASGKKPRPTQSVKAFNDLGRALVKFDASSLEAGDYTVRAYARDPAGRIVGNPGSADVSWSGGRRVFRGPVAARRLNNFVMELLRVAGPDSSGRKWTFVNPRTGWIHISNLGGDKVKLVDADGKPMDYTLSKEFGEARETMRFLPAGRYSISVSRAKELTVRTAGQTVHATANIEPVVPEFGPYGGTFEERCIFPHVNTLEILPDDADKPFVKEWRGKGRMILPHIMASISPKAGQSSLDAAYEILTRQPGFTHPLCDGNACDEFGWAGESTTLWGKTLKKALSEPRFKGRTFYPYSYRPFTHFDGEAGRELVEAVKQCGGAYLWEAYVKDQRTEVEAWRHLNQVLVDPVETYSKKYPGLVENVIVCSYIMLSAPNESTMTLSSVNLKTLMDMQFNMAANHPAFEGVRGMLTYRSNYSEKETLRWAARLFRHYCIEGRTDMLSKDPYLLAHLQNPAFEQQGRGWDLTPAEQGGLRFDIIPGLSWLAMGYPPTAEGDTTLITTRSAKGPNLFSQEIKGLEPGRLYCLRMVSADAQEFARGKSNKAKHAVSITLDNATLVPEECLTVVYPSCYSHHYNGFSNTNPLWMTYHVRVFRATGETASLTIADWAKEKEPAGPIGQELMYTYLKVQPYWSE